MDTPVCTCVFHRDQRITNFCRNQECLLPMCPRCVSQHVEDHNANGTDAQLYTLDYMLHQTKVSFKAAISKARILGEALLRVHDIKKNNEAQVKRALQQNMEKIRNQVNQELLKVEQEFLDMIEEYGVETVKEIKELDTLLQQQARKCESNLSHLSSDVFMRMLIKVEEGRHIATINEDLEEISSEIDELSKTRLEVPINWFPLGAIKKGIRDIFGYKHRSSKSPSKHQTTPATEFNIASPQSSLPDFSSPPKPPLYQQFQSQTMSHLKSKLRLLFEEISAEYERLFSHTSLQMPHIRLGGFSEASEVSAVDSIIGVFRKFAESVNEEMKERKSNDEYEQLEKSLQTQEAEIRNHIRLEQQMKLYAESLQAKAEEAEKSKADTTASNTKTILILRKEIEKLQEEYRAVKEKEMGGLVVSHSIPYHSSKQKNYGSTRYDTENRRTPTKQNKQKLSLHTSSSFLSRCQVPYQDITNSIHVRTHADEKHRSVSKEQGFRRNMKGSSIHILSKKANLCNYRKS